MSDSTACASCGDFLSEKKLVLGGLALCRPCFEPRTVDGPRVIGFEEPPGYVAVAITAQLGVGAAGGVVGALIGSWRDPVLFGLLGTTLGVLLGLLVVLHFRRVARGPWRREELVRVGLDGAVLEPPTFVAFYAVRPRLLSMLDRWEPGFIVVGPAGIVFLGSRGRREVIPWAEIVEVRVEGRFSTRSVYARLELRSGRRCWLECMESPSFLEGDYRGTRALAERIRAGLCR